MSTPTSRWQSTTPQWLFLHAVTYGVSRDQPMTKHKANHIQVVYTASAKAADRCLLGQAAVAAASDVIAADCQAPLPPLLFPRDCSD